MPNDTRHDQASRAAERVSLGFANLSAAVGDHIGHFFQTSEEWRAVLIPFLKNGLSDGHKCVYVMSPDHAQQEIEKSLADEGVDVAEVSASGQLVLEKGRTTPQAMRDWLAEAITDAEGRFPMTRWGGDMTWSLKKMPTSKMLMEWECMCNVIDAPPVVFLCQYDLTQFRGDVVIDAFKTHPLCIVGNLIHQNPLYVEPEVFLRELGDQPAGTESTGHRK